jgi:hypothetical protein
MVIPASKYTIVDDTESLVKEYEQQYNDGLITQGEKYNKVVDAWGKATEKVADEMMQRIKAVNSTERPSEADELDLHDEPLRRSWFTEADVPARRHARPDGQAGSGRSSRRRSRRTSRKA